MLLLGAFCWLTLAGLPNLVGYAHMHSWVVLAYGGIGLVLFAACFERFGAYWHSRWLLARAAVLGWPL